MQNFRFVVMRWVAIFVIVVGIVGMFSSIWSAVDDYIFQPPMPSGQDFRNLRYEVPGIFTFGMIIAFGAMMFRYANKQVNGGGTKSDTAPVAA